MAKKSFRNTSMNFISQDSVNKVDGTPAPARTSKTSTPAGFKLNPEFIETKSKRVQVLLQPSVYEAVKARAQAENISVNEAINTALKEYVKE